MSIYQKFIESATTSTNPRSPSRNILKLSNNQHVLSCPPVSISTSYSIKKLQYDGFPPSTSNQNYNEKLQEQEQQSALLVDYKNYRKLIDDWLIELKSEPELEPMSCMEAPTLTIDKNCASAMSIRCSQVLVQDIRLESKVLFDQIDLLIKSLPIKFENLSKLHSQFSELKIKLLNQMSARAPPLITTTNFNNNNNIRGGNNFIRNSRTITTIAINDVEQSPLTITFTTPKKSQAVVKTLKPIDKLKNQIKNLCNSYENQLCEYLKNSANLNVVLINNGFLESELRTLKELYEKFLEIIIKAECINIVQALNYNSLYKLSQNNKENNDFNDNIKRGYFEPFIKPFESSYSNIPLKWALIALWQLTFNDNYICRILTEKWNFFNEIVLEDDRDPNLIRIVNTLPRKVNRKLDFTNNIDNSNKYHETNIDDDLIGILIKNTQLKQQQQKVTNVIDSLGHLIINQPNKHQRIDVMKFMQYQRKNTKLIDLDETYQQVSRAIFTINQYKVAALKILIHLSVNQEALKVIVKLFFGFNDYDNNNDNNDQENKRNKILDSIFKTYIKEQEHTYENDTILNCDIEEHCEQPVVCEALKLIIQITNQFHQNSLSNLSYYYNIIDYYSIECFVNYITNIIMFTSDYELLLLSLNSIANVSFITIEPIEFYNTDLIIINVIENKSHSIADKSIELELRDQTVTILANLAEDNPIRLIENNGLIFLLNGLTNLNKKLSSFSIKSDLLAIERIQQKTAITIARLSKEPICIDLFLKQGGLKILIDICKYGHMRNYSTTVLLACVVSLKLLAKSINRDCFRYFNALDLVELNQKQILDIYGGD